MGLFSSKKKIYVSSTVYSMAGDRATRPDFLRTVVGQYTTTSGAKNSLTDTMTSAFSEGPRAKQMSYLRWCKRQFPEYVPTAQLRETRAPAYIKLDPYLPRRLPGSSVEVQSSVIENGDFFYWAEQFILHNNPSKFDEDWTCDDMGGVTIQIQYEDLSTVQFQATGYDPSGDFLYVKYREFIKVNGVVTQELRSMWIYRIGSGIAALDNLTTTSTVGGEFFPVIPLRVDNVSIRDMPEFEDIKKIYRKYCGEPVERVLDQIEDNDNLSDIDYCFQMLAVPMNGDRPAERRYLYEFFRQLIPFQKLSTKEFADWKAEAAAIMKPDKKLNYRAIRDRLNAFAEPEVSTIALKVAAGAAAGFDIRIHWANIDETFHIGQGKPGAAVGEFWFGPVTTIQFKDGRQTDEGYSIEEIECVELFWQTGVNSYRKLTINGLIHENWIYGGKAVTLRLSESFSDTDESGMLIPMYLPALDRMPTLLANQLCTENSYLIFNCYQVVKQKWYQRGIFRILAVVILAVVVVLVNPAAAASASGILGTNAAIGAAAGLTGLSATILGAVANAVAASILTQMIGTASTAIFGEEFGAIIGTIATIVAMNTLSSWSAGNGGFNLQANLAELGKADNLLKLLDSGARAVGASVNNKIADMNEELGSLADAYDEQQDKIASLAETVLGYSGIVFNPLILLGLADTLGPGAQPRQAESSEQFLRRTLLLGSEIAALDHKMIGEFATLSLELPKAIQ